MGRNSTDHQRKAGWGRARQWAAWRRNNPSIAEKQVQDILTDLGYTYLVEYEITHTDGRPQWFDIFLVEQQTAIEVDGSHGWHCYNGEGWNNKMAYLDELKARYCNEHGIRLILVPCHRANCKEYIEGVLENRATNSESLIPF
jgi:hypothetical protein